MEHARLLEKLLHEIASARAGIATNYLRLWREEQADDRPKPTGEIAEEKATNRSSSDSQE